MFIIFRAKRPWPNHASGPIWLSTKLAIDGITYVHRNKENEADMFTEAIMLVATFYDMVSLIHFFIFCYGSSSAAILPLSLYMVALKVPK